MVQNILMISLTMSFVIAALLLLSPIFDRRYSARWRCIVWLTIALRLIVPLRIPLNTAPIKLPDTGENTVVTVAPSPDDGSNYSIRIMNRERAGELAVGAESPIVYAPLITLRGLIAALWAIGSSCFLIYHLTAYAIFRRKTGKCRSYVKTERGIGVYTCPKIKAPMMTGFIKPIILLPGGQYSEEELGVILKHELMHCRRGDMWFRLLLLIANSVHFFNPLVYIMVNKAQRDMEYSCDDAVVKQTTDDYKKFYSMTILKYMKRGNRNG